MTDRLFFAVMLSALVVIATILLFGCGSVAVSRAELDPAATPYVTLREYTVWCGPNAIALVNERRECRLAAEVTWPTPQFPFHTPGAAADIVCGKATPTRTPA